MWADGNSAIRVAGSRYQKQRREKKAEQREQRDGSEEKGSKIKR